MTLVRASKVKRTTLVLGYTWNYPQHQQERMEKRHVERKK